MRMFEPTCPQDFLVFGSTYPLHIHMFGPICSTQDLQMFGPTRPQDILIFGFMYPQDIHLSDQHVHKAFTCLDQHVHKTFTCLDQHVYKTFTCLNQNVHNTFALFLLHVFSQRRINY